MSDFIYNFDTGDIFLSSSESLIRRGKVFGETGMTRREDEEIFVLSDEIIDYIHGFFPRSDGYQDETLQACMAIKALINVIGIMLSEIDSDFTIKAVTGCFFKMLEDLSAIRAEIDGERKEQSIH